jgi:hypothetical protein
MDLWRLLQLVVLNTRQIFAGERKVQSRRAFISICSLERTLFAFKLGQFIFDGAHEMLARCLSNSLGHYAPPLKAVTVLQQAIER